MFGRRNKAAREAVEAIAKQKLAEEEAAAEAAALAQSKAMEKTAEAKRLNAEVTKRLRRRSCEPDVEHISAVGSSAAAVLLPGGVSPAAAPRRKSLKVDRTGNVSSADAAKINKLIAENGDRARETRKRAVSLEGTCAPFANDLTDVLAVPDEEKQTMHDSFNSSFQQRRYKDGVEVKTGRERLAEMTRDADAKLALAKAGALPDRSELKLPADSQASRMIGAARASAKIAGGVFYMYAENTDMLSRSRQLQVENQDLLLETQALRERVARLEAAALEEKSQKELSERSTSALTRSLSTKGPRIFKRANSKSQLENATSAEAPENRNNSNAEGGLRASFGFRAIAAISAIVNVGTAAHVVSPEGRHFLMVNHNAEGTGGHPPMLRQPSC